MTAPANPAAPRHLSPASRKIWEATVSTFELEAHHLALLNQALSCLDRAEQARAEIGSGPLMVKSRLGEVKVHPLIVVERAARAQFGTLMKTLGLDVEAPTNPPVKSQLRRGR